MPWRKPQPIDDTRAGEIRREMSAALADVARAAFAAAETLSPEARALFASRLRALRTKERKLNKLLAAPAGDKT
jgi:hypothetical protein